MTRLDAQRIFVEPRLGILQSIEKNVSRLKSNFIYLEARESLYQVVNAPSYPIVQFNRYTVCPSQSFFHFILGLLFQNAPYDIDTHILFANYLYPRLLSSDGMLSLSLSPSVSFGTNLPDYARGEKSLKGLG